MRMTAIWRSAADGSHRQLETSSRRANNIATTAVTASSHVSENWKSGRAFWFIRQVVVAEFVNAEEQRRGGQRAGQRFSQS
jgi:hypothetical protein